MSVVEQYLDIETDHRTLGWTFLGNLWPVACILGSYLYFIYKLGPRFMEKREPYNLKIVLGLYNFGQVMACIYIIHEIYGAYPDIIKFWECRRVDYSDDPKSLKLLKIAYFTMLLKMAELIETIFFVLRKKQNQVSFLHVYHHCTTILLTWLLAKYYGGGSTMFSIFLNSFVHVIMYSYYLSALFGKDVQMKLLAVKKYITIIQMVQFCILILQVFIMYYKDCLISRVLTAFYMSIVVAIFYMFYDFYQKSYNKKNK